MNEAPLTPSHELVTKYIVLQQDLGLNDNLYGGRLLFLLDNAAAVFASQAADNIFVTYSIESMRFLSPVKQGDILEFYAAISKVTNSGMEIDIIVKDVDTHTCSTLEVFTTKIVMVAVDKRGRKTMMKLNPKYEKSAESI